MLFPITDGHLIAEDQYGTVASRSHFVAKEFRGRTSPASCSGTVPTLPDEHLDHNVLHDGGEVVLGYWLPYGFSKGSLRWNFLFLLVLEAL